MTEAWMELPAVETLLVLEHTHNALERGGQLIIERQKLMITEDRSELGWSVVVECTANELAEDSDDEKRLEKAERAEKGKATS